MHQWRCEHECVHALDVLGDPVRRRILEMLADGEASASAIATAISDEFTISKPAVNQHLRVLHEQGFATVRPEGQRRLYAVDPSGPREAREWLSTFDGFWMPKLAAFDTELVRGPRQQRLQAATDAARAAAKRKRAAGSADASGAGAHDDEQSQGRTDDDRGKE